MNTCWDCNNIRVQKIDTGFSIKCTLGKLNIKYRIKMIPSASTEEIFTKMETLKIIYKNKLFLTASRCDKFDDEE